MSRAKGSTGELQRLLQTARRDVPSVAAQQRFQSDVLSAVRSGAATSTVLSQIADIKPAHLSLPLTKIGISIGVVVLSVGALSLLRQPSSVGLYPAVTAMSASAEPGTAPSVPSVMPPVVAVSKEAPDVRSSEPVRQSSKPVASKLEVNAPAGPSEVSLIEQAHRLLQQEPKRALALTESHRKLYPSGILSQEREVIAIEALKRIGKDRAAEQRAQSFRTEQPHSIHESRIRSVLGDAGVQKTP